MGVRLQVFGVVLLGLLSSGGAGLLMRRVEVDNAGQALDRRVAAAQESVASTAQRYVDAVQLTAGGLEALPEIDAGSFATTTAPLDRLWLPGATSIDFVVAVPASGVADAQAGWRARGAAGLTLRPAAGATRHYFTVLQRPLTDDASGGGVGQDLTSAPAATVALERAQRVGLPAVSDPYVLLRDAGLPPQRRQRSVVLLQRVLARDTGELRGFVEMAVRMQDFFTDTMLQPSRELPDVTLSAVEGAAWRPMARLERPGAGAGDLHRTVLVQVADQQWQLAAGTDGSALIGADGHLDEGLFFGGLALTLVTALLVHTLATSRRRAEDRVVQATADLRQQAALLSAVMNTIGDGVVVLDRDGAAVWVSPAARELLGPGIDRHPPGRWPRLLEVYEADGATPFPFADLIQRHQETQVELVVGGRRLDVRLRPLARRDGLDGSDGSDGSVAVLRDVTGLHDAAEKVRASEELLQVLLDGARDYAIYMLDRQGSVVSWSANAEQLKGYPAEEVIGHSYAMFFTAQDAAAGLPQRLLAEAAEQGRVTIDGPRVRRDGSRFWAQGLLTAVRDPDGSVRGFVKVSQDVSARKAAELAVEQLNAELELRVAERTADLREANAELESFSYSVSHDLRAPLRAVDGFAKMLALDYGDALDEQARRYIGRIRAGAQHMGDLIDGLLAFSRLQRQEMASQRVHVDQLVADVWDELGVERGTRDIVLTVGDLPDAQGDPRLIRHVVANLVGNAVKYTRDVSPARVEVGHMVTTGGESTYYVRDNGAGFDMRYADKLFKVFQRLHRAEDYEGTGIGLALTHRIVQRHGGQIWADAAPGEGATFFFTLPAFEHTVQTLLEVGG
ncbi:PAS domain S-box protein [Dactylosporangium aurantiacum]|uniref:Sensor-like histidine kinase SenX3 n=1 Tax=Dactylosporangium aurantiacum TaxID=35754 RepID=A0A9Q9IMA1_9ACTN|nr:ATP-binding protein [Dactylosporangium aurantiacum]MDG6104936.1 PAS domain S-box protein [Dactylosporangium aurantiacum]UWZ55530.1 PAS domain S-box protein [Dactylosporangium aurantiacum]